jgi:hypothetical protein
VAERLKAPASKAGNGVPSFVGSNPTLSANIVWVLAPCDTVPFLAPKTAHEP